MVKIGDKMDEIEWLDKIEEIKLKNNLRSFLAENKMSKD